MPEWRVYYMPTVVERFESEHQRHLDPAKLAAQSRKFRRNFDSIFISAHELRVVGGALVFLDAAGTITQVFGASAYIHVRLDDDS